LNDKTNSLKNNIHEPRGHNIAMHEESKNNIHGLSTCLIIFYAYNAFFIIYLYLLSAFVLSGQFAMGDVLIDGNPTGNQLGQACVDCDKLSSIPKVSYGKQFDLTPEEV
jgi:hypothetical protein